MRVLFLDIDGVLNSKQWYQKRSESGLKTQPYCDIDPKAIKQLNRIEKIYKDVKIVISSTWRHHIIDSFGWNIIFELLGCNIEVIDVTPRLQTYRGTEIAAWILEYHSRRKKNPDNCYDMGMIDSFVIVDDDDDMEMLSSRLVLCENEKGLTEEAINQIIEKLAESVNLKITVGG
jgi:hypothetical protein